MMIGFETRFTIPTPIRCHDSCSAPSRNAELASSNDWIMKSCRQPRVWRVATIAKADRRNSPPTRALSESSNAASDWESIRRSSVSGREQAGDHRRHAGDECRAEEFADTKQAQLGERGLDDDQHQHEAEDLQQHQRNREQYVGQPLSSGESPWC